MADETIPPLPKGYTPVKSDNTIPPLPRGYSPVKKKVDTTDGGNTSPLSVDGLDNFLSSPPSTTLSPITDPQLRQENISRQVADDNQAKKNQRDIDNRTAAAFKSGEILNNLKSYSQGIDARNKALQDPSTAYPILQQESEQKKVQQDAIDTAAKKIDDAEKSRLKKKYGDNFWGNIGAASEFLGSKLKTGGANSLDLLLRAGGKVNTMLGGDPLTLEEQKLYSAGIGKLNDAARGDVTPGYEGSTKVSRAVGGLTQSLPSLVAGGLSGGSTFYLEQLGQGAKDIQEAKDRGVKISPMAENAYVLGKSLIGGKLMTSLNTHTLFPTLPSAFRNAIVDKASLEVMNDLLKSGEKVTADDFTKAFLDKATTLGERIKTGGLPFLKDAGKGYLKAGVDLSALSIGDAAEKNVLNHANSEKVFDVDPNQLGENLKKVWTEDAPLFGALGAVRGSGGILFDKSPFKDGVVESLRDNNTPDNVQHIKDALQRGVEGGDIQPTLDYVDRLSQSIAKLPKGIIPKHKFNDAVDLVTNRDNLKNELSQIQEDNQNTDPAFDGIKTPQEQLLLDKIEQANDKLKDIATGSKTTYSKGTGDDEGIFYKTNGGKQEKISESRYDLENTERDSKAQSNEQPIQGTPIENNVSETPQANETGVPETVGEEPIETTKNNIKNESNEENGGESIAQGSEDQGTETSSNESGNQEKVINSGVEESAPDITVNEVLNKPVTYKGEPAEIYQDGQTLVAKIKGQNREYELGNVDDIGNKSIKEIGIEHENSVVSTDENGDIIVRGKKLINNFSDPKAAINIDKEGNVISVNLETPEGHKRTFKGDVAEDIAYQIHLKELNKDNGTKQQFEQFVESNEPIKSEIVSRANEVSTEKATTKDNAAVSRKPKTIEIVPPPIEVKNTKINENEPARVAEQVARPTEPTATTRTETKKTENKPTATNEKVSEKSSEPIGISKAETKKQREARGLEDLPDAEKTTLKNMFEEGKQSITDGNVKPRQLAIEISDKPRNLSSTEVNALLADRRALHDEADDLRNTLGGIDPEQNPLTHRDISDRLRHVEEQLDNNENALRKGARENALALVSMQNMINSDYSHSAQLSRMRAAAGGELTPDMKKELDKYTKERDEAIKALEDYKKGEAERLSKEHVDNEVKKARKAKKAESKESLKAERKVIVDDFLTELKKIRKSGSLSSDIPYRRELAAAAPFMQKMITNLVKDGYIEFKDVIETVHDEFSKHIEGLTKRDVMDAISGVYHEKKETKNGLLEQKNAIIRLSKLTTKLEDLQNGLPSEKSEKRIVKKRDDIVNLEKEIKTLEDIAKIPEKERNAVKSRAKQLEKQIADYEQRIKDGKLHPDAKEPKDYNDQNIKDLEGKRDELTAELKKMRQDEFTLEEKQQRSLQGRLERINERIKNNDYDVPTPQPKSIPTAKTIALQAKVRRAENNFDAMAERLGNHSRGTFEKRLNLYRKINLAAILSGTKVLLKLIGYSAAKRFTNIMDEVANTVNSKTPFLKKIIDRSPRYSGGINARAEAKAIAARWNLATAKDVWETLGSGVGDLDRLYGKSGVDKDFENVSTILDMFQHLHGAFKTSAKRAEFFRSMQHRLEFAAKQGEDINDPDVQFKAGLGAYADAKRTILMSDNLLTDKFYKGGLQRLEQSDKSGKAVASFLRSLFPITKVPTNFVLNVYDRVTGAIPGLSRATFPVLKAIFQGAETLTPDQADSVARILAKGQVGLAFMAIAFFKPNLIKLGGYYAGKRDKDDLKAGDVIIGGVHIPHNLAHNDLIEAMQFATTVRRAMDRGQGAFIGIGQAGKGLLEQIPFVDSNYQKDLTSQKAAVSNAGEFIKNKIEPRLIQEAAEYGDKDTDVKFLQHPVDYLMSETKKRDPQTIGENLKTGIPGLRTQVQEKQEKKSEGLTNIKIDDGRNWTLKPSILKEREQLNEDFIKENGDAIIRAYSESFNRDKQKREEAAFKKLWEGKGASPEIIKKWILNKREAKIKSYLQDKANDASKGFLLDKYEKEDGDYDLGELKD